MWTLERDLNRDLDWYEAPAEDKQADKQRVGPGKRRHSLANFFNLK